MSRSHFEKWFDRKKWDLPKSPFAAKNGYLEALRWILNQKIRVMRHPDMFAIDLNNIQDEFKKVKSER